jgi:hypothetical protein
MPADASQATAQREADMAELKTRLDRIDAAENAHAREIEHLATLPADSPAVAALRTRILGRFTELEGERAAINAKLAQLAATAPAVNDPSLLDRLPQVPGILHCAPASLQQELYHLFGTQMTYHQHDNQVSCYATITPHATTKMTTLFDRDPSPAAPSASAPLHHANPTTAPGLRCGSRQEKRDNSGTTLRGIERHNEGSVAVRTRVGVAEGVKRQRRIRMPVSVIIG